MEGNPVMDKLNDGCYFAFVGLGICWFLFWSIILGLAIKVFLEL